MFTKDAPIHSSKEDLLGRAHFAVALAEAILAQSHDDSLTIGLYGSWGSGKTSIVNMTIEHIEQKKNDLPDELHPIVVKFSPWNYSDQDMLVSQFFRQVAIAMNQKGYSEILKKVSKGLERLSKAFEILRYLPAISPSSVAAAITRHASKLSRWAGEKLADLDREKERLSELLSKQKQRLVIVIDDIDRLNNTEIRQVFQLVKALADFPNTVYLLAFDKAIVGDSLEETQHGAGSSYLEKIIQVPFEIPQLQRAEVHAFLLEKIRTCFENVQDGSAESWDIQRTYQTGIKEFINDFRDAIRYTNVLRFLALAHGKEVRRPDVSVLTALQVFEPTIFDRIRSNKHFLTAPIEVNSPETQSRQQLITHLNGIVRGAERVSEELLVKLFKEMFPKLNLITDKQEGQVNTFSLDPAWREAGRVCNPVVFDIAFALSIPKEQLSKAVFEKIVADARDAKMFRDKIDELQADGRFVVFLQRLHDYAASGGVPLSSAKKMINVLVDTGDTLNEQEDCEQNMAHLVQRTVFALAKCIEPPDERRDSLISAIEEANGSLLIPLMVAGHREVKSEDTNKILSDKIGQWDDDGRLIAHPRIKPILASWRGYGEIKRARDCIVKIGRSEPLLINFLGCFLTEKKVSAQDETARRIFQMNLNSVKEDFDLNEVMKKLKPLRESSRFNDLAEREQIIVRTFLEEFDELMVQEKKRRDV